MERRLIREEFVDPEEILLTQESEKYKRILEDQGVTALRLWPSGKKPPFYRNIAGIFEDLTNSTLVAFSWVRRQQKNMLKRIIFDSSIPVYIFSRLESTNAELNKLYNRPGIEGSDVIRFYHPYLIQEGENLPLKSALVLMCGSVKQYSGRLSGVFHNPYRVTTTVVSLDNNDHPAFATYDAVKSPVDLDYGRLPHFQGIFLN